MTTAGALFTFNNMPSGKMIRNWELLGVVVIFFAGAALHFVFEWSGYWKPIAWLVAINESTWEHFKLAFWPGIVWALIEYCVVGKGTCNYWIGKALGLLSMPIIITVIFYSYTTLLGTNYLVLDILSFFLAISFGQFISYRLFFANKLSVAFQWLGALGLPTSATTLECWGTVAAARLLHQVRTGDTFEKMRGRKGNSPS